MVGQKMNTLFKQMINTSDFQEPVTSHLVFNLTSIKLIENEVSHIM